MRNKLAALLIFLAALVFSGVAQADIETQGWHQDPANSPSQEHLHQIVKGISPLDVLGGQPRTVQVSVLLHNSRAHINWVRWQCESDTQQQVNVNFTGTGAHEETFGPVSLTIDPAKCGGSWREIRIASNSDKGAPGGRTFPTTRLCLSMTGSGANYCGGPTAAGRCGGGQWYTATEYSVSTVDCRDVKMTQTRALVPGDKIRVKAQTDTAGGKLYANIDPKFHDFNPGIVAINGGPSGTWQTVTIPSGLPAGAHKLVVRSHEANGEEGVFVLPFTTGAAPSRTIDPLSIIRVPATATCAPYCLHLHWVKPADTANFASYEVDGQHLANAQGATDPNGMSVTDINATSADQPVNDCPGPYFIGDGIPAGGDRYWYEGHAVYADGSQGPSTPQVFASNPFNLPCP